MGDKMKVRDGNDGYSYPYTSPDLVVGEDGKSVKRRIDEIESKIKENGETSIDDSNITTDKTWSSSKIDSQFKDIAKKTIIEGNKIYLVKSDGTKLDEGTDLPTSSSSGNNMFEEVSSEECTINETVNATALLQGTIGCGSPLAYDEEGNIIAYDEGNIDITERNYQNGICNLSQSGVINYDDTKQV